MAQFLRARAWWRLDCADANAVHVARSVVSLIDAAGYVQALRDDDPGLTALDAAGCFAGGVFDPGPDGWMIVREWQLAYQATAGPRTCWPSWSAPLAATAPASLAARPAATTAITIPRQPGPAEKPAASH